jgi:hypothetical protein
MRKVRIIYLLNIGFLPYIDKSNIDVLIKKVLIVINVVPFFFFGGFFFFSLHSSILQQQCLLM